MRIYLICNYLLFALASTAQVRMEKDYNESFDVNTESKVEIANKYGEVIIRVWNENRVKVTAKVTAEGKNQEAVNKSMNRVNIAMRKIGPLVSVNTQIDNGSGSFKDMLDEVEGYSIALFGKQKLTVNYEIWLPENITLSINNKYGDVYIASLSGEVTLTLAHGDLKASRMNGRLDMEHSYGKSTFDYVNRGRFTLRGADMTIEEGSSYSFQSSSSTINLYNAHYVKLDSRNDKIRAINVNELIGTGRFTNLQAERVSKNVDLNFNFGEINLSQIDPKFKSINLIGKSTDVNLVLNQASFISARIKGEESKMVVPNSMMSLSRDYNSETKMVTLSGMVGHSNDFKSTLNVDADGGSVIVSIKETPIFTDRR